MKRSINAPVLMRRLHLYFGLLISPFLLVYAISTLFLNHSVRPQPLDQGQEAREISIPADLSGMPLVHEALSQLELSGEILGRGVVRNDQTTFRLARPGSVKIVKIDLKAQQATLSERRTGLLGALIFLHFNPGLHKPANWIVTKLWGWLADGVVYLTLFLTVSGVYLWLLMKAERKVGLISIGAGVASFVLILAALLAA